MLPIAVLPTGIPQQGFGMKSLRYDGINTRNTKTFASGNRTVWTLSFWIKLSALGVASSQIIFEQFVDGSNLSSISFNVNDKLQILNYIGGVFKTQKISTRVFRDVGSWCHIVVSENGTTMHVYVNNEEITTWDTNTGPDASNWFYNTAASHSLGDRASGGVAPFGGYLADVVWVDGSALTPSSFAQTNATTGKWEPKKNPTIGLTMGTNGFWLSFDNNSSTANLGLDDAGGPRGAGTGSNDWTQNNFSVTAGVDNDSFTDVPMDYNNLSLGTGNYCVLSTLVKNSAAGTFGDGGLKLTGVGGGFWFSAAGTFGMPTGKWYWEFTPTANDANNHFMTGIYNHIDLNLQTSTSIYPGNTSTSYSYYGSNGNKYNAGNSAYGATYTVGDVIGVAFDADNGKLFFAKNNTWQNSGDPVAGTNAAFTGLTGSVYFPAQGVFNTTNAGYVNFGQRPLIYTPPTGYKTLCTQNITTPTIIKPNTQFDVKTYTGNASTLNVTGMSFQPDFVWIKGRSGATGHRVTDSVRGVTKSLETNSAASEATEATGLTAFNSDGFTLGADADYNTNAATYVAWCMKEGVTPGLDVISYAGDNTNGRSLAHNLGVAPKLVIGKNRNGTPNYTAWNVFHTSLGADKAIYLNSTSAVATDSVVWFNTLPDSSNIRLGQSAGNGLNTSGVDYIIYAFAEVPGFSRFGSYVGNGNANGPFVWCGFRPKFILFKDITNVVDWVVVDAVRGPYNITTPVLYPSLALAESGGSAVLDILSNGFKQRISSTGYNANAATHIFMAFAENPFKYANAR